jgi:polyisoprenoid-binding protein YceI
MKPGNRSSHWKRWLAIGITAAVVLVVGGPFAYIHFIEGSAPAPLTLASASPSSGAGLDGSSTQATDVSGGNWKVADGSVVGYRVNEVLFGQTNEAVGRTSSITGSLTVDRTTVTAARFSVDMTTVTSDQSRRDDQFNGRIMETATYPTATFALTKPIDVGATPAAGSEQTFQATGDLTMHGVTRSVTFKLTARYAGSAIQIAGSIPVTFADWNIPNPSFGPVSTEDHGILEFAVNFAQA